MNICKITDHKDGRTAIVEVDGISYVCDAGKDDTEQSLIDKITAMPKETIEDGITLEQAVEKVLSSDLSKLDADTQTALDTKLSTDTVISKEIK